MTKIKDDELLSSFVSVILKTPVYLRIGDHIEIPYIAAPPVVTNPTKVELLSDGHVVLYNMLTQQMDEIHIDNITSYRYCTDDNNEIDSAAMHKRVNNDINEINDCVDSEAIQLTKLEVISRYCVYGQSQSEWSVIKHFHCKYTINQLREPSDALMVELRDHYMNLIREHRVKSFEELDQLEEETKKQGGTDEDLQDIDTIKQMFRDIPQDIDLNTCKSVIDLYEYWPSLMLPKPKDILHKHQLNELKPEETIPVDVPEIRNMLSKSNSILDLNMLLSGIDGNEPTDLILKSEIKKHILYLRSSKTLNVT